MPRLPCSWCCPRSWMHPLISALAHGVSLRVWGRTGHPSVSVRLSLGLFSASKDNGHSGLRATLIPCDLLFIYILMTSVKSFFPNRVPFTGNRG